MILAVALAFGAAASFAAGSALQHRVAGAGSDGENGASFIKRITRQPSWLVGLLLSAVAFTLHASALSQGDLALVQPVIVSGIVFAVIIRYGLARRFPPLTVLGWLIATWAGLALFLASRPKAADHTANTTVAVIVTAVGVLGAVVLFVISRRIDTKSLRGVLLAAASGTLFGLVAGEAKLVLDRLGGELSAVLGYWPLWVLLVVGAAAILLNQRAYQVADLSVTAPVLNILQVLVALAFGALVLDETSGSSAIQLVGQVAGLALVILGVFRLASHQEDPDGSARPESQPKDDRSSTVGSQP